MRRTLRTASPAAVAGLVAALGLAGCGSTAALLARAGPPSPSISPVSEQGAVRWVDQPGQFFEPKPLPVHYRPANAPPCTAAQVRVSRDGKNGAGGYGFLYFAFRNIGRTTCILRGYPSVVASKPGAPDVTATRNDWFAQYQRPGNMRPGGVTDLMFATTVNCQAGQAPASRALIYHTFTVTIPGGGLIVIHQALGLQCGLSAGRFWVRQPPQRYTHSPVSGARVALELPSRVVAGTTLDYVAALTNPTGADMVLSPCPGYQQGIGKPGKPVLSLNCRAQRSIPAHQTVRFAMRLPVPAGTPTGPADVYWWTATPGGPMAHGSLHVYGRDTPCRGSQLHGRITGPGRVPGPPNVMGLKKMATEVPLTVTDISGRACSVYGVPTVAVRAADGAGLGLHQVPSQQFMLPHSPLPDRVITLSPHTGTAWTTLDWYLPWCAPDPNPVTVAITFPADGAVITVTPAGGWKPTPCRHLLGPHATPGWVSAGPFQAGTPAPWVTPPDWVLPPPPAGSPRP